MPWSATSATANNKYNVKDHWLFPVIRRLHMHAPAFDYRR
jgi:hypothetical protein